MTLRSDERVVVAMDAVCFSAHFFTNGPVVGEIIETALSVRATPKGTPHIERFFLSIYFYPGDGIFRPAFRYLRLGQSFLRSRRINLQYVHKERSLGAVFDVVKLVETLCLYPGYGELFFEGKQRSRFLFIFQLTYDAAIVYGGSGVLWAVHFYNPVCVSHSVHAKDRLSVDSLAVLLNGLKKVTGTRFTLISHVRSAAGRYAGVCHSATADAFTYRNPARRQSRRNIHLRRFV